MPARALRLRNSAAAMLLIAPTRSPILSPERTANPPGLTAVTSRPAAEFSNVAPKSPRRPRPPSAA